MGLYTDHILPHLTAVVMDNPGMARLRPEVVGGVSGTVVELGFGAGLNLPFYGAGTTRVLAVDPDGIGFRKAAGRIADADFEVTRVGLDGARVDLDDASADHVVCTWTLCTIPDVHGALAEVVRVLKPGGTFRFVEHGLHEHASVAGWQRWLTPMWKPVAGGCHLDRPISQLVAGTAGLQLAEQRSFALPKTPAVMGWMTVGVATRA